MLESRARPTRNVRVAFAKSSADKDRWLERNISDHSLAICPIHAELAFARPQTRVNATSSVLFRREACSGRQNRVSFRTNQAIAFELSDHHFYLGIKQLVFWDVGIDEVLNLHP